MRALVIVAALSCTGCFLDRSGTAIREDAGGLDAGGRDAATGDAGAMDAGALDGGLDAGGLDAGEDAGVDAGPGRDAGVDAGPGFCDEGGSDLRLCIPCEGLPADASSHGQVVVSSATPAPGRVGQACAFGAGTTFVVADAPSLDPAAITVELFFRPDELPSAGRRGLADKNGSWGIFIYPGGVVRCTVGGVALQADGVATIGTWTHVACAMDASGSRLFIDGGVADSDVGGTVVGGAASLNVGEDSPGGGDQLVGAIDELRVFSVRRSDAEILAAATR